MIKERSEIFVGLKVFVYFGLFLMGFVFVGASTVDTSFNINGCDYNFNDPISWTSTWFDSGELSVVLEIDGDSALEGCGPGGTAGCETFSPVDGDSLC